MTEADAEDGHVRLHEVLRVLDRVVERRRIAGAVAEKHAVGIRSPADRDAGAVAGNTRTSQPYAVKRRRMFHFMPKSYAAILQRTIGAALRRRA